MTQASTATDGAKAVLRRVLGKQADCFELGELPTNGRDTYEIEARDGKVRIVGTTAIALTRGAYDYIRNDCHRLVTWGRMQVSLPTPLPPADRRRVDCPVTYRHYFNVCTFGYSTVWWDWKRWEQEIDWMALHGINMPLSMNGQEAVWQQVWLKNGLSDSQIRSYFSGPAFLPWHRMGNINSHAGPLSQSWIDGQKALQKQILKRERELGMTPITPAFSGFVPPSFRASHPKALIAESSAWAGFEPTYLLSPRDPLFQTIGKEFIELYTKEFGTSHHYLADVYNEMTPRLPESSKYEDLEATGKAVYDAITAGDPKGNWVMQAWLFYNDRAFWGAKEADAFLRGVPDDRMTIIDLACDSMEVWRAQPAVRRKNWIYCTLHNFGETTALFGDLNEFSKRPMRALADPGKGNLIGMGITPEGIEQNPVVYELATDMMWRTTPVNMENWIRGYAHARYGTDSPEIQEAWRLILRYVYDGSYSTGSSHLMSRPGMDYGAEPTDATREVRQSIQLLLSAAQKLGSNHLLDQDIVDLMKRYLEEVGGAIWLQALLERDAGHMDGFTIQAAKFFKLLDDLDRLLGTIPEYRLSTWIQNARKLGRSNLDSAQLEENARLQVTVWGGPILHDYAWKEWSGLLTSFYKQRWIRLLRTMLAQGGKALDMTTWDKSIADWELSWTKEANPIHDVTKGATSSIASEILAKYPLPTIADSDPGIAVGKPVTDSGRTEAGFLPKYAVDGKLTGDYWSASPYPQWLQIDLQKDEVISKVQVVTYHDGERSYQYTVDDSIDGKTWTTLVDMRENQKIAPIRGIMHSFEAKRVRYVRVNMLHNSANIGVHLYEVRIWRANP